MNDRYLQASQSTSRLFTKSYSTSFSLASRLFAKDVRKHIYVIYGLTRIADEVVDSYDGSDAREILDELEKETCAALTRSYSTNPIVHAFQNTARCFGIDTKMIRPFFASMRSDVVFKRHDADTYQTYIHGSAEVVGLMCLRVFTAGNERRYQELAGGAAKLGSAYQKINFLRDLQADYTQLGRYYFPIGSYSSFDEKTKQSIVADIRDDLGIAVPAIGELPPSARRAVQASYNYYELLLRKLSAASPEQLKSTRFRIPNSRKLFLLAVHKRQK